MEVKCHMQYHYLGVRKVFRSSGVEFYHIVPKDCLISVDTSTKRYFSLNFCAESFGSLFDTRWIHCNPPQLLKYEMFSFLL